MSFSADEYLAHHGIKGQKWGVRRFQNSDGSLTAAGKERYIKVTGESSGKDQKLQKKNAYNYVRDYRNGKTSRHEEVKNKIKEATKNERAEWEKANKELAKKRTDLEWKEYLEFENNGWKLSQSRMDHYESLFNKSREHSSYQKAAKKYSDAINREVDAFFGKYADKEFDGGHTIRDDFIDKKIEHLSQYEVPFTKMTRSEQQYYNSIREDDDLKHSDDFLEHHGIKGQKWGVRRFQNPDGSLTIAGRQRYLTNGDLKKKISELRKKGSAIRKRVADIKRARNEAEKKSAIAKGDLDLIYKHIDLMSTKEINDAINRVTAIKNLKSLSDKRSVLAKAANTAGNLSSYGDKFINLANTIKRMKDLNKKEEKKEAPDTDYEDYMKAAKTQAKNEANRARKNTMGSDAAKEYAAAAAYKTAMNNAKKAYNKVKAGDYYKAPASETEESKTKKLNEMVDSLRDKSVRDVARERSTSANRMNARLAEINKRDGLVTSSSLSDIAKARAEAEKRKKTVKIKDANVRRRR